MGTKAEFIAALGGGTVVLGTAKTFTTTHAADTLTITDHGKVDGDGPIRLSSSGQLPAELGPQKATGGLTHTPGTIADDVVQVGAVYYQFAADPTAGAPTGLVGSPFLVDVGVDDETSLANLLAAINASGTPGTTYSAELTVENPGVEATASAATTITLRARAAGTAGNALAVVVTGNDGLAADAATLLGGTAAVDYYVILVDENTIKLSLTVDGAAVAFGDDGSGTHSIGGTAQGVADTIENQLVNRLTYPGVRVRPAADNISEFWDDLIQTLI